MKTTVLIAEDEETLAVNLAARLAAMWPESELVAIAPNGIAAVDLIGSHRPDVVFIDIKMPGISGLSVVAQLPYRPYIVFVTAYGEHAVEAFEREAVDYLLKPVSDERMIQTIVRLKSHLHNNTPPRDLERILANLLNLGAGAAPYLQWIRSGIGNLIHNITPADVVYFAAEDKYTRVITRELESLIRTPIGELEKRLDPAQFVRVHRGTIVNLKFVKAIARTELGTQQVSLVGRKETLTVSRAYSGLFRQM